VTTDFAPRGGPYAARLTHVTVGCERVALWRVADLEAHVDRDALLRGEDAPEPPYWAHLWSGARLLAAAVPARPRRVLEVGCGLGLPSLVAARRGAWVLATDREQAPLAFVRASARANGVTTLHVAAADVRDVVLRRRVDLVLLAEVLYDRSVFADVVTTLDRVLAPGGEVLIADGRRIDTSAFWAATGAHFDCRTADFVMMEEGFPVRIRLARLTRRRA
jgi:predicted nicotinamide N-methyase